MYQNEDDQRMYLIFIDSVEMNIEQMIKMATWIINERCSNAKKN